MARTSAQCVRETHQKEFAKHFDSLCGRHSRWEVWADFIMMAAIEVSCATDKVHAEKRCEDYRARAKKYSDKERETLAAILADFVNGIEENPDQDFLGELYMDLELGNDHAGQFFTPYSVCRCMTEIATPDIKQRIEEQHWIGVSDPACGAGALMVAFANHCMREHVNYQNSVLFVAQDIDYIVGMMCYLQLSFMGCAGYVVIGDSLLHPSAAYDKRGLLPHDDGNVWYTPMFSSSVWYWRRQWAWAELTLARSFPEAAKPPQEAPAEPLPDAGKVTIPLEPEKPLQTVPAAKEREPAPMNENQNGQLTFF